MKRATILLFLLVLLVATPVCADQFQVFYRCGGGLCYVANSSVEIWQGNRYVPKGHTDHYGRITINLSRGTYSGRVYYQGRWWNVKFYFDGRRELKRIYLN